MYIKIYICLYLSPTKNIMFWKCENFKKASSRRTKEKTKNRGEGEEAERKTRFA